jgi:hypothetical protein
MEATLQINPALYRAAAAAAAREGVTVDRFVEALLRARLPAQSVAIDLPTFDSGLRTEVDLLALIEAANREDRDEACRRLLSP